MAKRKFSRFGRTCPTSCKEICCVICDKSVGAIEFIPTRPSISCKEPEKVVGKYRKKEGIGCPSFVNHFHKPPK